MERMWQWGIRGLLKGCVRVRPFLLQLWPWLSEPSYEHHHYHYHYVCVRGACLKGVSGCVRVGLFLLQRWLLLYEPSHEQHHVMERMW